MLRSSPIGTGACTVLRTRLPNINYTTIMYEEYFDTVLSISRRCNASRPSVRLT